MQPSQHLDAMLVLMQLASGGCFGMHQPIAFRLLASREESLAPLEGMAMELEDSLYPLLRKAQPSVPHQHDCVRPNDCM